METRTYNYKRVYVWELPVRLFHWTMALCVLILIATGFVIANPPAISSNAEAINSSWFGFIRTVHFATAFVLIAALFFRVYWAFAGNKFAHWSNFIPYTKKGLKNILYVLRVEVFLMKDKKHKLSNISIGHNYLAAFSYFLVFLILIFQIFSGLALYADSSSWWLPRMFHFMLSMLGGDIVVRYFHNIMTWLFMAFIVVHVYLVLYHDYVEARGETSAMISGFKFIRAERIKETEDKIIEETTEQMWDGNKEKDN